MTKSANTVAAELVRLARASGRELTPMQLLKLVYIAHGWNLALYDRPLVSDRVEAWQYGPVIPRLYNSIRRFRGDPVNEVRSVGEPLNSSEADIVRQAYDRYGHLSGPQLSRLTHAKGSPWEQVYTPGSFGVRIPDSLIRNHYKSMLI